MPPLLLIDLDNTLIDRDAAFATWVRRIAARAGGSSGDVDRILAVDDSGYGDREEVGQAMTGILGLDDDPDDLVDRIRHEHVDHVELNAGVRDRLARFAESGVDVAVLTNGNVKQQTMKLERVGLAHLVSGAVISEEAGLEKPDPEIFRRALADRDASAAETWMVGDNADADIRGAQDAGLRTGWVSLGRQWPGAGQRPTVEAETTAEVLDLVDFGGDA